MGALLCSCRWPHNDGGNCRRLRDNPTSCIPPQRLRPQRHNFNPKVGAWNETRLETNQWGIRNHAQRSSQTPAPGLHPGENPRKGYPSELSSPCGAILIYWLLQFQTIKWNRFNIRPSLLTTQRHDGEWRLLPTSCDDSKSRLGGVGPNDWLNSRELLLFIFMILVLHCAFNRTCLCMRFTLYMMFHGVCAFYIKKISK